MNDLTAKQAAFVAAYLETGHIQNAAIKAGYAERGAHVTGSRLLRNPKIAAKIKTMRQKAETASTFTLGEAVSILARIARGDDHPMARIRAIEVAGRMLSWETQQGDIVIRVVYADGPDCPPARTIPAKVEPVPEPCAAPAPVVAEKPKAKLYQ